MKLGLKIVDFKDKTCAFPAPKLETCPTLTLQSSAVPTVPPTGRIRWRLGDTGVSSEATGGDTSNRGTLGTAPQLGMVMVTLQILEENRQLLSLLVKSKKSQTLNMSDEKAPLIWNWYSVFGVLGSELGGLAASLDSASDLSQRLWVWDGSLAALRHRLWFHLQHVGNTRLRLNEGSYKRPTLQEQKVQTTMVADAPEIWMETHARLIQHLNVASSMQWWWNGWFWFMPSSKNQIFSDFWNMSEALMEPGGMCFDFWEIGTEGLWC